MARQRLIGLLACGLTLALCACSEREDPVATIDEGRVADAYADLTVLSESVRLGMPMDTTRTYEVQVDSVLGLYGMTRMEFEEDFHRLADDPTRSRLLFELATKRIQALRSRRDSSATMP